MTSGIYTPAEMDTAPKDRRILARTPFSDQVHIIWWDDQFHRIRAYGNQGQWVTYGEAGLIGFSPRDWMPIPEVVHD